jgi:hypothetical protein
MARYLEGITGAFSGKVGPVVGSSRNGVPYMKSKGNARTSVATGAELANRKKFSAAHTWLKPLLPLLRVGFKGYSQTSYGFNAAKSYLLKHAMENGLVIPAEVKISNGDLPPSAALTVTLLESNRLQFNWSPEYMNGADPKDQLIALAYHPESSTAQYIVHGAFRETGEQILELSRDFIDKTVHVYAAFVAADRDQQSDSIYLGPILIA